MIQARPVWLKRACHIVLFLGMIGCGHVWAQPGFGLSVTSTPSSVFLRRPLTYTITVTSPLGFPQAPLYVTNQFSADVSYVSSTNSALGSVLTNANTTIFVIPTLPDTQVVLLSLVVLPQAYGILTNTVTVSSLLTSNATTQVTTPVIAGQSDLGVSLTVPAQEIYANDRVSYTLTVTNLGPDSAPGVVVSNALPADVLLTSVTPSSPSVTFSNQTLVWNLGTLASQGGSNLLVRVQPSSAGTAQLRANVSAANVIDSNPTNDSAGADLIVSPLISGTLQVTNLSSAMTFNPQTALMEQTVRLVNVSTNPVASARVAVSGLTNRLFNAVGTNNGAPFVVHRAALAPGASVDLLLNYLVPNRLPIQVTDSQLHAYEISAFNPDLPPGTPIGITQTIWLPNGSLLIEFPTSLGRTYSVVYSDDANFTTARPAQPSVLATADRTQWIDYGPPQTLSRPTNSTARFYRVIQNP